MVQMASRGISKTPGRPQRVTVKSMDKSCILHWSPPKFDGGSTVTGYRVDRQEIGRPVWISVIQNCKEKTTVVRGLCENKQHVFRIAAVNINGTGEFLQTGTFTTAKRCEPPLAPGTPVVTNDLEDYIDIKWQEASSSSDLIGYTVERRREGQMTWRVANTVTCKKTTMRIFQLERGHTYEFRVMAESKVGLSKPSGTLHFRRTERHKPLEDFTQLAAEQSETRKLYHFRQRQTQDDASMGGEDNDEDTINSSEDEYLPGSDEEEDDDDELNVDDEGNEELPAETEPMTEEGTKLVESVSVLEEQPMEVEVEKSVIFLEEETEVVAPEEVLTEPECQHEGEPDDEGNQEELPAETESMTEEGTKKVESVSKIIVLETNNKDKRKHDKKQFCVYCGEPQSKLPRHLYSQHNKEPDVAQLMALPKGHEKELQILKLRNLGNHLHNNMVMRDRVGELVVVYRPSRPTSHAEYTPCPDCLGWYSRQELYRHSKECKLSESTTGKPKHVRVQAKSRLLIDTPMEMGVALKNIFSKMSSDEVSLAAKADRLILAYARKLYAKYGHEKHQHGLIKRRVRDLGRLLVELRTSHGSWKCLGDFVNPQSFKDICAATKTIAGFQETTNSFSAPSAAERIGLAVKGLAKTVQSEGLQNGCTTSAQNARALLTCIESDWGEEIADHVRRTFVSRRRNKVLVLPITADIQKLAKFVEENGNSAYEIVCNMDDITTAYETLRDCLLVSMMTFNRRRQGEVSRIKLSDMCIKKSKALADVTEALSDFEKTLISNLSRIEICGKRGRTVPVILTSIMQRWLEKLLDGRKKAGVLDSNPYIFARIASDTSHIRGCDVLRQIAEKIGAAAPESLRSTLLRKHIATTSQILNLRDNELDILADFLGHDIMVHRRFYRLPQETLQLAKVSKLLMAMESGCVAGLKGKNLDDIQLGPDEELEEERIIEEEELDGEKEPDMPTYDLPQAPQPGPQVPQQNQVHINAVPLGKSPGKTAGERRTWSKEEITAVEKHFLRNISLGSLPGKAEIETCKRCEPLLHRRQWRNIKDYIRNRITKKVKV